MDCVHCVSRRRTAVGRVTRVADENHPLKCTASKLCSRPRIRRLTFPGGRRTYWPRSSNVKLSQPPSSGFNGGDCE